MSDQPPPADEPSFTTKEQIALREFFITLSKFGELEESRLPHGSDAWEVIHRFTDHLFSILDALEVPDVEPDRVLDLIP